MSVNEIEIIKGKVASADTVYEWKLGLCEEPYPHVTIDYYSVPEGRKVQGFAGRSPSGLIMVLEQHSYPIPDILQAWSQQLREVEVAMLSGSADKSVAGLREHYTGLSEDQIKSYISESVSELFREASISLALYTYHGIKVAEWWNERLDALIVEYADIDLDTAV